MAVLLSISTPTSAHADLWCWLFGGNCNGGSTEPASGDRTHADRATPEIDPAALAGAFALAAGAAAVFGDRLRRRRR